MQLLTSATALALDRGRDRYNAAFRAARKSGAPVDRDAFLLHVSNVIAPIVDAVAAEMPERAVGVLDALYTVSIELFSASLLGPAAKIQSVNNVWTQLLPRISWLLMRDPQRVAAALSNAAYNLGGTPGVRSDEWIGELQRIAPLCERVGELLDCGKIAAWRAGMAHYRKGAHAAAKSLPPTLASAALGLSAPATSETLDRFFSDPWAATSDADSSTMKVVARVGAFRGFGGRFICPPRVWPSSGHLFAGDDETTYQLIADRYGDILIRHEQKLRPEPLQKGLDITPDGTVTWINQRVQFPQLAGATSVACDGVTLAVTLASSHHIFLIANGAARAI